MFGKTVRTKMAGKKKHKEQTVSFNDNDPANRS